MDPAVAGPIKESFRDLAAEFDNTRTSVLQQATAVDNACGQMRDCAADGTDAFHMAWGQALEFCGEASALVAGNINVFEVELSRLDEDLTHVPTI